MLEQLKYMNGLTYYRTEIVDSSQATNSYQMIKLNFVCGVCLFV